MKLISIHIDESVIQQYKEISQSQSARKYLLSIRANAGYSELMRLALENSIPKLQEEFRQ
jgi:hypothetical protein